LKHSSNSSKMGVQGWNTGPPEGAWMIQLRNRLVRLARETRGQDLIEYALMAAFVAVAAGAIFPTTIAPNISQIFSKIQSTLNLA
jgi:Flp pilus assembly pilin Flp